MLARREREGARGRARAVWGARESEAGGAKASWPLPIGIGTAGACGNNGGGVLRHGRHVPDTRHPFGLFIEYAAGSDMGKVGAELGRLRADLDLGPKSKVAAHLMIYKTH